VDAADWSREERRGQEQWPDPEESGIDPRRRRIDRTFDRSRHFVRRMDRVSAVVFVGLAVLFLGALNAGSSYARVAHNPGGIELFGLLRYAAVPAVIALVVRRRQHDSLTAAAQLAIILLGAEMLELGALSPLASHAGVSVGAMMSAGFGSGLSLYAAAIPIGAVIIWGARHFGDRRVVGERAEGSEGGRRRGDS
jgi:hypothetical protein